MEKILFFLAFYTIFLAFTVAIIPWIFFVLIFFFGNFDDSEGGYLAKLEKK